VEHTKKMLGDISDVLLGAFVILCFAVVALGPPIAIFQLLVGWDQKGTVPALIAFGVFCGWFLLVALVISISRDIAEKRKS
jgi:hypothetical protein